MTVRKLKGSAIQSGTITTTQLSSSVSESISAGGGPKISSLSYPGDDLAANTAGGQTVQINGSGFAANSTVHLNGNAVASVTYNSSSNLIFTTPALSAATYPVYVINPEDGATAIFIPGLEISGEPTWNTAATLTTQDVDDTWNIALLATSDSSVTYALADGSSLPSGITLASNGLISGTFSSPPSEDTTYNFSVVASDAENQDASRAFSVNITTGEGVLFANNVLLLHGDGTNNQNNNVFLDSSNNNFTITRNGNATQGSFSPFSQTGWSNYFDGTGDFLSNTSGNPINFGTGAFTVEMWLYANSISTSAYEVVMCTNPQSTGGFQIYNRNVNRALVFGSINVTEYTIISDMSPNRWYHIAISRVSTSANQTHVFVDGTLIGSYTVADNFNIDGFNLGGYNSTIYWNGYISNVRVVKGTALYTENFTPSTTPLQPIANTSLLTCQSNAIVDEGPNNFAITRNGDVSVQPFSPFAPVLISANSYSVYFDGNGDYLSVPDNASFNLASGTEFTLECWIYPLAFPASDYDAIAAKVNGGGYGWYFMYSTDGTLSLSKDGGQTNFTGQLSLNTWTHVAVVRDTDNNTTLYLNGISSGTISFSGSSQSTPMTIGYVNGAYPRHPNAYISNFRLTSTREYTSNFTPPTSPLTNIANTSLLTCQSPTFVDNSDNNFAITANGNAVPKKFNPFGFTYTSAKYSTANVGGSGYFDGTGDYLTFSPITLSGAFTAEAWVYHQGSNNPQIIQTLNALNTAGFQIIRILNNYQYTDGLGSAITGNVLVNKNSWNHLAISRDSGGTIRLFTNGVLAGSATPSVVSANAARISGVIANGSDADLFTGYIGSLRILNGTALYTSNFTPPTAPVTNIANTSLLCNFTNAGIFDSTAKNVLETVGDAKVSTAQYKYGTGSILLTPGNGSHYTRIPLTDSLKFGTGDFTIECWIYLITNAAGICAIWSNYSAFSAGSLSLFAGHSSASTNHFYIAHNATFPALSSTTTVNSRLGLWTHLAVVRSSGQIKLYINGVSEGTPFASTVALNGVGSYFWVGTTGDSPAGNPNCYIDDFRISRFARYTSNFTPPTSALKDR